ncbi:ABC transporter permease [Corynebacterium sp. 3HC-13]|uniref:YhgE/Pip family protein n=1 Tax=Corynebacterium poyangense TaxID=2684405 RepID=UPI001CCC263B|nr:YhgE/Pip domain-containing protein [Corynebacterium poyangense]MBZ8177882.1 ABC transporter permease [Corynebacterium poyangense]
MSFLHIGSELQRFFRGKLPPIGLAVIILLPLIFGGLFVWSYWDPVGGLSRLPVALVNSDRGAEKDGQPFNAGEQVAEKVHSSDRVHFIQTDPEDARRGVADGTYYFALELPEDFSEAAVSAGTDHPHPATINAVFNNANGFLGQMLGNQVATLVVDSVDATLGEKVTDTLLVGFNTIGEGMDKAGQGAQQLNDGTVTAREGSEKLKDGAQKLHDDGAVPLNDGAKKLADGAQALDKGIAQASKGADQLSQGMASLREGTQALGNGAQQVSGGVDSIVGLSDGVAQQQEQLIGQLLTISTSLRASGLPGAADLAQQTDGVAEQLRTSGLGPDSSIVSQLNQLRAGAREISRQLQDPNAEYLGGVERAVDGAERLATGLHTLKDGSQQLVVGTHTLSDGTSKLVGATDQLTVGATQLRDGLVKLDEGSGELALKITDGAKKVPRYGDDVRGDYASTIATPVKEGIPGDSMTLFGVGLAPFFISLGLFMGGTVSFMLLRPLQRRALDSRAGHLRVVVATYLPAMLIGCAQVTAMFLVLRYAIGLDPQHEIGLYVTMLGISSCFMAITHSINSFFGATIGRVLCLILMAIQLVSSGGLYPPETQPKFQQVVHYIDPMTYSVNMLRQMIVGPSDWALDHRYLHGWTVIGMILMVSLGVSIFAAWRHRLIRVKDLHPELKV